MPTEQVLQEELSSELNTESRRISDTREATTLMQQMLFPFAEHQVFEPIVELCAGNEANDTVGTSFVGAQAVPPFRHVLQQIRESCARETDRIQAAYSKFLANGLPHSLAPRIDLAPEDYRAILELLNAYTHNGEHTHLAQEGKGAQRMSYNGLPAAERARALRTLADSGVWNTPFASSAHVHLSWKELREITCATEHFLRERVTAILPFATEPWTIGLNADYAQNYMAPGALIAMSANRSEISEQKLVSAQHLPAPYSQREVLSCIDWSAVAEMSALPVTTQYGSSPLPRDGSKGLTLFAGLLIAHAIGKVAGRTIAFHDTDIVNPHTYDALRMLALPYVLNADTSDRALPIMTLLAKTGPGRNNEGWTGSMNLAAADPVLSNAMRMTARQASAIVWPLSGERFVDGDFLLRVPWTTGMSIETHLNLTVSSQAISQGTPGIHQVINGVRKIESGVVSEEREWNMMQMCRGWGEALLRFCSDVATTPVNLTVQQIHDFNLSVGGRIVDSMHQSPEDEAHSVTSASFDYLIPSIAQLEECGLVDWQVLESLVQRLEDTHSHS